MQLPLSLPFTLLIIKLMNSSDHPSPRPPSRLERSSALLSLCGLLPGRQIQIHAVKSAVRGENVLLSAQVATRSGKSFF